MKALSRIDTPSDRLRFRSRSRGNTKLDQFNKDGQRRDTAVGELRLALRPGCAWSMGQLAEMIIDHWLGRRFFDRSASNSLTV